MTDAEVEKLYGEFFRVAKRLVYVILRREDDDLAWELAGDGIMALGSFRGEADVMTWFGTLARNAIGKRAKEAAEREEVSIEELGVKEFESLSIENEAIRKLEWEDIFKEIKPLKGERELVERVLDGQTSEEIGWSMGVSAEVVRKRWQRIIERIRRNGYNV